MKGLLGTCETDPPEMNGLFYYTSDLNGQSAVTENHSDFRISAFRNERPLLLQVGFERPIRGLKKSPKFANFCLQKWTASFIAGRIWTANMCPDLNGSLFHHILETELQFKTIDLESSWGRLEHRVAVQNPTDWNTPADPATPPAARSQANTRTLSGWRS